MQTNTIYCGDCRKILPNYIQDEGVDLIYVDPPFFTSKQYEVIWGNGYELRAFEDRWKGGIMGNPIQIKQSENIGREIIDKFETAMKRAKKNKGVIIAFSFGKGAYEEVARAKNQDNIEIELKTVEEIIKEE